MPRTILVHLNVELPDEDERSTTAVAQHAVAAVQQAAEFGTCDISAPLCEEL